MIRTLWVCISFYQEEAMLPDCLNSIANNVPFAKIVGVDGVYSTFAREAKISAAKAYDTRQRALGDEYLRYTSPRSTDESRAILERFGATVIDNGDQSWPNEYLKRSKYFIGNPQDWYLVIDADERLAGKFPTMEYLDQTDNWCINLLRDDGIRPYPILRVHRHPPAGVPIYYFGAHHALFFGDTLIRREDIENDWVIPGCYLDHQWAHRAESNPVRHMTKGAYYRKLQEEENVFRNIHKI